MAAHLSVLLEASLSRSESILLVWTIQELMRNIYKVRILNQSLHNLESI